MATYRFGMSALVRRVAAVLLLAAVPACSSDASPSAERRTPSASPTSPEAEPAPQPPEEPTVLVAHHTRGRLEATADLVDRIADGRVATWRPLDGTGDPLRVARTTRAVTRDPDAVAVLPAGDLGSPASRTEGAGRSPTP